jgi:SNF2 family DNA or RNA helicase
MKPDFSASLLHRYHWHRIVLDEAHCIKDRRYGCPSENKIYRK